VVTSFYKMASVLKARVDNIEFLTPTYRESQRQFSGTGYLPKYEVWQVCSELAEAWVSVLSSPAGLLVRNLAWLCSYFSNQSTL
jgi:hypothetical protein